MSRKDWVLLISGVAIASFMAVYIFVFSGVEEGLSTHDLEGLDQANERLQIEAESRTEALKMKPFESAPSGVQCFTQEKSRISQSMSQLKHDKKMKYFAYRQLFRKFGVEASELVARLVYSETLASRCEEEKLPEIFQTIFWVIKNRILKKGGVVQEVIFEFNQFASSLHNYDESMMDEFLCPSRPRLWKSIASFVDENWGNISVQPKLPIPKDGYNFFLFQHRDRPTQFSEKHWAKTFPVFKEIHSNGEVCVKFYKNRFYR